MHDSKAQRRDQQLDRGKDPGVTTPTEVFEAALAWHQAGFCVIPPAATGRKSPLVDWKQYQSERPTAATMRLWYDNDGQQGVGLLCGQVSGNLEMLELEGVVATDAEFMDRIADAIVTADTQESWSLKDLWDHLQDGYHEFTPSGGLHLLYRISDHPAPGNTKIARRPKDPADYTDKDRDTMARTPAAVIMETLIETRGEGGYVIVAPSQGAVHPSGNPWVLGYDCQAGRVPTITWEQREALVAALSVFDVPRPRVERPRESAPSAATGTRVLGKVGDDFNARASWDDILLPHGWTFHHAEGHTLYWERPGGSSTGGQSASTGHDPSNDRLWVFSSSTVFPNEESITKFYAYCVAPETKILMSDLSWRLAGSLVVGDELVGVDEEIPKKSGRRKLRSSMVTGVERRILPCYRVTLEDGRQIVSTDGHPWLAVKHPSGGNLGWVRTEDLKVGQRISALTNGTWEPAEDFDSGWLGGMYDGEGWVGRTTVALCQNQGPVLDRAELLLKERGFEAKRSIRSTGLGVLTLSSLPDVLRLLGTVRPGRLLAKKPWEGRGAWTRAAPNAIVKSLEFLGDREVAAFSTSTRTFIAEGLVSHNTVLNHDGNWAAATRDLAMQGYGDRLPVHTPPKTFGSLPMPDPRPASMLKSVDIDTDPEPMVEGQTWTLPGGPYEVMPPSARVYLPEPGRETHTDIGAANRFLREHPHRFLWVAGDAEWRWYDGVIWQVDTEAARVGHAIELMLNRMSDEAAVMLKDPDQADMGKSLNKYVRSASMDSGRRGLLRTLASKNTVAARDLDPHLHLLGLKNGVLDVRTGTVIQSDPRFLLTRQMDVAYDPTADAPKTREYMETMLPEFGLREFTKRAIGYTMTGEQDQRAFIVAHGPRGSGKSQFVELWGKMFGDYGTVAADAAFRKKERGSSGPSAELHALQNYRFVWASENDEDVVFDGDIVKRICGGETMSTRTLYDKRLVNWRPECVVWLATNNFPRFPAEEEAIWDRVKPVAFDANFDRDGSGHERVLSISAKLHAEEAPGILNLMIEWLLAYRELGWIEPDTLKGAIEAKKTEGDPVAQFWADQVDSGEIVESPDEEIPFVQLYNAYKHWSLETLGQQPRGSRRFSAALKAILRYKALRKSHGKSYLPGWKKVGYNGINGTMTGLG